MSQHQKNTAGKEAEIVRSKWSRAFSARGKQELSGGTGGAGLSLHCTSDQ
jgi:hypothetical protein